MGNDNDYKNYVNKRHNVQEVIEIFCTLQFEGIHHWPECPFTEVSFLRVPHRHIFYIKAYKIGSHLDREVEFVMLKREISEYLDSMYPDGNLGTRSCEMLAQELCNEFDLNRCEVSEDGENGAIITQKRG